MYALMELVELYQVLLFLEEKNPRWVNGWKFQPMSAVILPPPQQQLLTLLLQQQPQVEFNYGNK